MDPVQPGSQETPLMDQQEVLEVSEVLLSSRTFMKRAAKRGGVVRKLMQVTIAIGLVMALVLSVGCIFKVDDGNKGPYAPAVALQPSFPGTTDDLVCRIIVPSWDPDGDTVTYSYEWYKDGVLQPGLISDTVASRYTALGEIWTVEVTPYDGTHSSVGTLDDVTVRSNRPPSAPVVSVMPALPTGTDDQVCSIIEPSTDPDGDSIVYTYQWYKGGVLQEGLTASKVDSSLTAKNQVWKCVVSASDGTLSSDGSFDVVTVGNSPPAAPVVDVIPHAPVGVDDLVCSITTQSSDADGDALTYTYQWYRDNVLQVDLTGDTVDSSHTAAGEIWECVVTATDGTDSSDSSSDLVSIEPDVFVAAHDSSQADKDRADYVCDGDDDDVQIQTAIDSLGSSGGTIYIAEGTYTADGTMRIEEDDITIMGEGHIQKNFSGGAGLFHARLCDGFRIEGLEIEELPGGGGGWHALVRISGCTNARVSGNLLHNVERGIFVESDLATGTKASDVWITDNEVYDVHYSGIGVRNGCEYVHIERNEIHDSSGTGLLYGIATQSMGEWDETNPINEWVYIRDNLIYDWDGNKPIDVHGGNHVLVEGNTIYNNTGSSAIYLHAILEAGDVTELHDWQVIDNDIEGTNQGIWITAEYGIEVDDIVVSGNTIREFAYRGIYIEATDYGGVAEFHNVDVHGNTISEYVGTFSNSVGIRLAGSDAQCDDFEITGNSISGTGTEENLRSGIEVSSVDNGVIESNELSGSFGGQKIRVTNSSNVTVDS